MKPPILYSSSLSAAHLFSMKLLHSHQNNGWRSSSSTHHKKLYPKIAALKRDGYPHRRDYDGKLIDQNMIVLRKRIQEMKIIERSDEAPSEWMEWEKKYYADYNSDVCKAVGVLQLVLMNTRPSLALIMVALFTLSVPTSFLIIMLNLLGWINGFSL